MFCVIFYSKTSSPAETRGFFYYFIFLTMGSRNIIVATGPYGTELENRFGKGDHRCKPKAVLHDPEVARAIAEIGTAYVKAGAKLVLPHTFGARLALEDGDNEAYKSLVEAQVGISRRVLDDISNGHPARLTHIPFGPHGQCYGLDPLHHETAVSFHSHQIEQAAELGLTPIFETTARIAEVEAIVRAAEKVGQKVVIGLMLGGPGTLLDGNSIEAALAYAPHNRVDGFILNCGELEHTEQTVSRLNGQAAHIVGAYPNPTDLKSANASDTIVGPKNAHEDARRLLALGREIGTDQVILTGCCGYDPKTVGILSQLVREQARGVLE